MKWCCGHGECDVNSNNSIEFPTAAHTPVTKPVGWMKSSWTRIPIFCLLSECSGSWLTAAINPGQAPPVTSPSPQPTPDTTTATTPATTISTTTTTTQHFTQANMWFIETPENYEIVVLGQLWPLQKFIITVPLKLKHVVDRKPWKLRNCGSRSIMTRNICLD